MLTRVHSRVLGARSLFALVARSVFVSLLVFFTFGSYAAAELQEKPNVVLIMTDNHGPWTLGCYGNKEIRTPHIDRLAKQGTLFTHAFANNAVCSPTRATWLTGLMPSQHGVHRYLGAGRAQIGPNAYCTIGEFRTFPKIMKEAGYTCGLSGKWHLGNNLYPQEGFSFWITKPHGHSKGFYDQEVIEDGKIRKEPEYLTKLWTDHGIKFIQQNKEKPFFLMLAYNGPYGLGGAMLEPIKNRHREYYSNLEMKSFPREEPSSWLRGNRNLINKVKPMRKYAAETSAIDDGVGEIMATLKKHGLDDNTIVIFTADQGLAGGHSGFWGMGDHTRPLTAYDPTMHIPLIFHHPGKIVAAQRSDLLVSNYDFLRSMLDYLKIKENPQTFAQSPGRSFASVLRGKSIDWDNVIYYEFENVRAVRTEDWKYIERIHQQPNELYDLKSDPGERNNLYGNKEHAKAQQQMKSRLDQFFKQYADPKWDLWNGGKSKTGLITAKLFKSPK